MLNIAVLHRMEVKLKMWSVGTKRSKDFTVQPLSEEAAIKQGADLIGELVIFSVGAGKNTEIQASILLSWYVQS